jgi:hypothetical protein
MGRRSFRIEFKSSSPPAAFDNGIDESVVKGAIVCPNSKIAID